MPSPRGLGLLLFLVVFASAAHAATINVVGLFPGKAVVVVDGAAPRSVGVGESVGGYKLVSVGADSATFLVDGKRQTIAMGSFLGGRVMNNAANNAANNGGNNGANNGASDNAKSSAGARASAMVAVDSRGHYATDGTINGAATRFLIDTGATLVVLSANEARRLGIAYQQAPQGSAQTANGAVPYRIVKLDRVKVGDVELNNVEAGVMEGGYDGPALLGMSFLSRTEVSRDGQNMVLTKRF